MTVVGWIDVFTRKNHKMLIISALKHCQKEKALELFGYCIMSNHIHLIARACGKYQLSNILRDFKKYTSKAIIDQIQDEPESRRRWMLDYFKKTASLNKRHSGYQVWENGNHAEVIYSNNFFDQKLDYIHNNPVKELIVERPEDYIFSSARNYAGLDNYIDIIHESVKMITYH
jgi:REP element-mobilizing transposase RayT